MGPRHMVTGQPKDGQSQQATSGEFWLMDIGSSDIRELTFGFKVLCSTRKPSTYKLTIPDLPFGNP